MEKTPIPMWLAQSNEWTGRKSFAGENLHARVPGRLNPYEHVLLLVSHTLAGFADSGLIPAYGFGDSTTQDHSTFSFMPGNRALFGPDALLQRYQELTPTVRLSGPTSFAPVIYEAMKMVASSGWRFHILLIIGEY
jgi:E3 ubiquitin-protein ligase RGLG